MKKKLFPVAVALMLGITGCAAEDKSGRNNKEDISESASARTEEGTEHKAGTIASEEKQTAEEETGEKASSEEDTGENMIPATEVAAVKEPRITLSGNAADVVQVKENSYYEGDRYVLYFEKGTTIHGDMAKQIEKIMKDEEDLFGLKYEKTEYLASTSQKDFRKEELGDSFAGVNPEREKVDILIMDYKDDGAIEWSDVNTILLFDEDFEAETGGMRTVYHEMGHVLRLRQSPQLGSIIEEGIGNYSEDMLTRKNGIPDWSLMQYYEAGNTEALYDASAIEADPEKAFREINDASRSSTQPEYAYGFRFIHFLRETYGEDVVKKLSETAGRHGFEPKDTDAVIQILKETTSEDVFERFGKWLPEGWKKWCAGYREYMQPFGFDF